MTHAAGNESSLSRRDLIKGAAAGGLAAVAAQVLPGCATGGAGLAAPGVTAQRYAAWSETLAGHTIVGVESRVVQNRWPRLVTRNARLGVHGWGGDDGIAIIHTDKGAVGWGFAPGMNDERAREYTDRYKGQTITQVFDPAVGTHDGVPRHMDMALHDLAGIVLDLPVYKMIGGAGPTKTPLYSGMIYFDDLEPYEKQPGIEQVLFNAGADYQYGYRWMKIKVGRGNQWMPHDEGLERDIDVTRALHEAYPDVTFLADANDGYSVQDTKDYLDGIGFDLFFMEEPFRENAEGFAELRRYLDATGKKTLIADGEHDPNQRELDELIAKGLLDLHLTDVYGLGFTNWRKLMPSLIERGVLTSPHTWGSRLKTVGAVHLAAGFGNMPTIEGVTAFSKDIDYADYDPDDDGNISPPDKPGFGLALR